MALKPQDVVVLLKIISIGQRKEAYPQSRIAYELCMSVSEINSAFKRLIHSNLLTPYIDNRKPQPIIDACIEFLVYGIRYVYPPTRGEMTRGVPTAYAAPVFEGLIGQDAEPIPVWPYAEGEVRGMAYSPLYSSVPESVSKHPCSLFYDLLCLVDAIRNGRAREKKIAIKLLKEKLKCKK